MTGFRLSYPLERDIVTTLADQSYELVDIARLFPHPDNPRRGDVGAIAESLDAHGFYGAVVAQRSTGRVLAGNHRLLAARERGLTELPVVWVDVDDDEARRILLVDNRANDVAGYDQEVLVGLLSELAVTERALSGTGYDEDALAELLALGRRKGGLIDPDAVPGPPPAPVARVGDVWRLGEHRLVCGDATEAATYKTLLGGQRAACVWTDPPYGVAVVSRIGTTNISSTQARQLYGEHSTGIMNDELDHDKLHGFLTRAFESMLAVTQPGAAWYVCAPHGPMGLAFSEVLAALNVWRHSLVWVKSNLVLGRSDYHYRHEPIYYGWTPGGAHRWYGDRKQDTVVEVPVPNRNDLHPTMKPIELISRLLENSTKPADLVLDPFSGSGSTLIACEQAGRSCRAIELDPKYVDVTCRRWQEFTGLTPVHEGSGKPHDFTEEVSDG